MNIKKRLLGSVLCLLTVIVLNFALPRLMPGSPVVMLSGQEERTLTAEEFAVLEQKLGLNNSIPKQFLDYISGIVTGNLGYSYHLLSPVGELMSFHMGYTLMVAVPALLLSVLIGCAHGCWAGWRRGSVFDKCSCSVMLVMDSVASFLLAMLLITVFAFNLGLFPLGGIHSIRPSQNVFFNFFDLLWHLFLPILACTLIAIPSKFMLTRNCIAAAMDEKYVVYALARGLSQRRVCFVHLLKNVAAPIIASIGLSVGLLISGSMIIEVIFSIPGMGSLIYTAAGNRDYPTLQGCFLVISAMVIAANIIADLLCLWVDPMARNGRGAKYED